MQLYGATELELRLYHLCRECETEMPAGEWWTRLVVALSDAASRLQATRQLLEQAAVEWSDTPNVGDKPLDVACYFMEHTLLAVIEKLKA